MSRKKQPDRNMEQAILEAAENLFLERGYALTSTVEIAKRVGCNQALVHYYFRTKENLFRAIFGHKVLEFIKGLAWLDELDLPFEQTIARIVESHFDTVTKNKRLPLLIINELTTNPERLAYLKDAVISNLPVATIARLEQKLQAEIRAGRVRPMTMMDLSITLASLNVMLIVARPILMNVLEIDERDYDEFMATRRAEHVEIVLRSIRP